MKIVKYIIGYVTEDVFGDRVEETRVVPAAEFKAAVKEEEERRWGDNSYMTTTAEEAVARAFGTSTLSSNCYYKPIYSFEA